MTSPDSPRGCVHRAFRYERHGEQLTPHIIGEGTLSESPPLKTEQTRQLIENTRPPNLGAIRLPVPREGGIARHPQNLAFELPKRAGPSANEVQVHGAGQTSLVDSFRVAVALHAALDPPLGRSDRVGVIRRPRFRAYAMSPAQGLDARYEPSLELTIGENNAGAKVTHAHPSPLGELGSDPRRAVVIGIENHEHSLAITVHRGEIQGLLKLAYLDDLLSLEPTRSDLRIQPELGQHSAHQQRDGLSVSMSLDDNRDQVSASGAIGPKRSSCMASFLLASKSGWSPSLRISSPTR